MGSDRRPDPPPMEGREAAPLGPGADARPGRWADTVALLLVVLLLLLAPLLYDLGRWLWAR